MATSKELTKAAPIPGATGGKASVVDAWAKRAARNSVQWSRNDPSKDNTMTLPDTNKRQTEKPINYPQCKYGG